MYCMIHFQNPVCYWKFRHIRGYSCPFQTHSVILWHIKNPGTLEYSEPCQIENPGIFRTQDILRTLSRHILAYSEQCARFPYWELCHIQNFAIQNFGIFKTWDIQNPIYLGTFMHIQTYSIMTSITTLIFFFSFNLTYFSTKFRKKYVFWLQWRQFQCLTKSTDICDLWK